MKKYQQDTYIPKDQRKTILFMSDDMRMNSGIATVTRNIILGTCQHYNYVQLAAAIKHPDSGKRFDLSQDINKQSGISDSSVIIYPNDGYGNPQLIRQLMMSHQIDAILHFTDPRFWEWLYLMEHEIREYIPIFFYHIWDDIPKPMYNRNFYESCDWIGNISKQTYSIVRNVWGSKDKDSWNQCKSRQVDYIPHGINEDEYFYIDKILDNDILEETKRKLFKKKEYDFIVFWNNRNIRRKMPGDVILGFSEFCKKLPKAKSKKCVLLMHTSAVDNNGTNLPVVKEAVCPDFDIVFTNTRVPTHDLNRYYNISDVTINMASNEGWGLSCTESMMTGTMIINNVTGGLQDQIGFKLNGKYLTEHDYIEIETLHDRRKWQKLINLTHGDWAVPIWPTNRALVGSVPTPYIYDDRADWADLADAIKQVYDISPQERIIRGNLGREFALSDDGKMTMRHMCSSFITNMNKSFMNFKKRKRFDIITI